MKLIDTEKLHYKRVTINENKSAVVVFAKEIDKAEQVEAIPYGFLRELAKNQPHYILTVWDFLPKVIENIIKVWEDWEKENE